MKLSARHMMGQLPPAQNELFYDFYLDNHLPADHLLRWIDAVLDLGQQREHLAPYDSQMGRPSIDPELMIRLLIVGYSYSIRSERRLCEEVNLNLAYRWFCGLGLNGAVPDHSTLSKNGKVLEPGLLWGRSPWVFSTLALLYGALDRKGSPLSPVLR